MIPHMQAPLSGTNLKSASENTEEPGAPARSVAGLAELPLHEGCDPSTVLQGFLLGLGLAEHADQRLRAGGADEHATRSFSSALSRSASASASSGTSRRVTRTSSFACA